MSMLGSLNPAVKKRLIAEIYTRFIEPKDNALLDAARLIIAVEWSDEMRCPWCKENAPAFGMDHGEAFGGHEDDCEAVAFVLKVAANVERWP